MEKLITGIHHVNVKPVGAAEFERTVSFYHDLLGIEIKTINNERMSAMLDTGAGIVEIGSGSEKLGGGAITHFALATTHVDEIADKVRAAGYEITMEPFSPNELLRIAFVTGPCGESIELFDDRRG